MKNNKFWMILALAITLVLSTTTGGWAYLVDTGQPISTYGQWLYRYSNGNFAYNAAEFTLSQESTITGIEGWIRTFTGGSLLVVIYDDGGDLPGQCYAPKIFHYQPRN